jgi:phosphoribosyl 1,2-cyclic phosphodiesterase
MKFHNHYSSSKHNLYVVDSVAGERLLIECGCTPKKLLKAIDYDLSKVEACLISHEHRDHSKSVEFLLDAGIDCYMSKETRDNLALIHRRIYLIEDRRRFKVGGFQILPFAVEHDVPCMGFLVKDGGESLLFVTDTFMVKQRFGCEFNIIAICCNYDGETLQARKDNGDINETYAKRLLTSHMEIETTKAYLRDCCNLSKCTEIHLLHMSGSNAEKQKIREEIENEFFIKTFI